MLRTGVKNMKFILALSNWIKDWEIVKEVAQLADKGGFWGLGMPDHYLWTPGRDHTLETWIALTHLASITQNVHVGTIVSPISFRPPSILAKMVSTVDVISNGRTFLGVGAGWSQREFETYSEWNEPKVRVSKTEEAVRLIKAMWSQENIDFEGNYYSMKGGVLEPKPLQKPHPPLLFGGFGTRMLKLAGKYADIISIPSFKYENFNDGKKIAIESAGPERASTLKFASSSPVDKDRHFAPVPFDVKLYSDDVTKAEQNDCDYYILSLPEEDIKQSLQTYSDKIITKFA